LRVVRSYLSLRRNHVVDPETTREEWQWTPVSRRMPYDRQLVLRKMVDEHQDVHFGIGWYEHEKQEWVITARPNVDASLQVIAWVAVPK
jgi:hypothetical protein